MTDVARSDPAAASPRAAPARRALPAWRLLLLGVLLAAAGGAGLAWWKAQWPKRLAVVDEGRIYRSGAVTPEQLERLAARYELRSVLSLLDPEAPQSVAERAAAERLGLTWYNVPLPGNGASTPEDRERIRAIVLDSGNGPMLIHCAAGANRTGLAAGMYRIHAQGWTYERVLAEMRDIGFEDLQRHENLRQALREECAARAP